MRRLVAVGAEHEALGRTALAEGRHAVAPGEHLAQAAVYFHFAKFVFVEDLDADARRAPARRALPQRRAAAPRPARPPGRDAVRGRDAWSASCGSAGDGPAPASSC